jgi:uncharacterized membrane protein YedE/YeeE
MDSIAFLPALAGGLLIGASALLLYAGIGRIAGISGITFGMFWGVGADRRWRGMFVAGLVLGAWLALLFGMPMPAAATPESVSGIVLMLVAGALVGAGTRLGNGCTSGHGVCGLARLSRRSLVAVFVFMGMGMLVATLLRPLFA